MKDEEKSRDHIISELRDLRLRLAQLESATASWRNGNISDDAEGKGSVLFENEESNWSDVRRLKYDPTATMDLSGLFTREVTDSGSFDIRGDIWATTFGRLLQALPLAAILIDRSGNVFQANQACERMFAQYDKFHGSPFCSLVAEKEAAAQVSDLLEKVFSDRQPRMREAWLKVNSSTIRARMTFRSIRIMTERFILTLLEDLTAQKMQLLLKQKHGEELTREIARREGLEQALRESEEKYRLLVENTKEVIFVIQDGKVQFANAEGVRRSGYSLEDLNGRSFVEFVHPDDRALAAERYRKRLSGEEVTDSQAFRILGKDGTFWWGFFSVVSIEWKDSPALLVFGTDITDLQAKDAELRDSEERFRSIFFNSHAVMIIVDHETGSIEDANPAACAFYGYSREELAARKIGDINLLPPEELFREMELARLQQRNYFHFRHMLANGAIRDVEVYCGPIMSGGRVLLYSIIHDITDRKSAEADLKTSRDTIEALFNATDDSVYLLDTKGKFLALNQVTAGKLESRADRLIGFSAFDSLPSNIAEGRRERFEEVIRTAEPIQFEDQRDERILSHSLYPVLDRDKRVTSVAVFSRDISGWRTAQVELTESRQRLELALQAANLGLWDWNIHSDKALLSGCTTEMLEYLPDDIDCQVLSWDQAIHPEDKPRFMQTMNALVEGRAPYCEIEYRLRAKSGRLRWILTLGKVVEHGEDGRPLRAVGTHLDITERKRLEEERDHLFTLSLDMLCVAGFDGYFKQVNPAWSRTLGWTELELLSKPWRDFVHPDDWDKTSAVEAELATGRAVFSFENRYRCEDGTYRWISWNSFPLTEEELIFSVARDNTSHKEAERRLAESEELFRTTFEQAASGVCHVSPQGRFLRVNQRVCEIWDYSHEELLKLTFQEITHPEHLENDLREIRRMLDGETDRYVSEKRYIRKNGSHVWCNLTLSLVTEESGRPKFFIAVVEDITERKRLESELKRLARRDSLTGTFNRQHFLEMAEREFDRARRYKHPLAVLMLDVDHFKTINDTYGHHAGDATLKALVTMCTETLRGSDLFGRLGGEEFGAVLTETGPEMALRVAERLRKGVEKMSIPAERGPVRCSVSIGVTSCTDTDKSLDEAMRRADMALYEAKEAGRNRVVQRERERPEE